MNRIARSVLGMSAGVVLAGVSACATPPGGSESERPSGTAQQSKALERFDPCTFFNSDELNSWGLPLGKGKDSTQVSWEPSCRWSGDEKIIDFSKNVEETVDSYKQSGNWESYEKQQIAGRSAAVAQVPGAGDGGCNILVDAGGGVAIYQVTLKTTSSADPCQELKKIAEATAARLPE
ncbi:DUF3558 family protein [Salinifilum ghardaiensis]